jgi:hypothetical protein
MQLTRISRAKVQKKSSTTATDRNKLPRVRFYKHWHDKLYRTKKYESWSMKRKKQFLTDRLADFDLIADILGV